MEEMDANLDEEDEVIHYYRCRSDRAPRRKEQRDGQHKMYKAELDPIRDIVVAGVKIKMLRAYFRQAVWLWIALGILIGGKPPNRPLVCTVKDHAQSPDVFVSEEMRRFKRDLCEGSNALLRRLAPENGERVRAHCGLFAVEKKIDRSTMTRFLRVIFDARPGNLVLERIEGWLDGKFNLFSLEDLLKEYDAMLKTGKAVHCLNLDLRHWFYQLPIPAELAQYFAVQLDHEAFIPKAVPMGWHAACYLGQCVTWALVYQKEKGQVGPEPGRDMPKYLKLPDGTCVFVLMDGVFIFGTEEQSINEWEAKLRSKCQTFGVTIKQQERWQERGAAKLGDDTKDRESVGKSKFGNVS